MSALDDIYVFQINGHDYCQDCFIEQYFYGDRELLEDNLEDGDFTTINDESYSIVHEGTIEFESYRGQILPIEGIFCRKCGNECYPPDESTMCFHKIAFSTIEERKKFALTVKKTYKNFAIDSALSELKNEKGDSTYEMEFYTYDEIDIEELLSIAEVEGTILTANKSIHTM